jgi:hypothetical protein
MTGCVSEGVVVARANSEGIQYTQWCINTAIDLQTHSLHYTTTHTTQRTVQCSASEVDLEDGRLLIAHTVE